MKLMYTLTVLAAFSVTVGAACVDAIKEAAAKGHDLTILCTAENGDLALELSAIVIKVNFDYSAIGKVPICTNTKPNVCCRAYSSEGE